MAPDVMSWNSQVENMADSTIRMGSWSSASSVGMLVTTLGGLSPCRNHAISANPGGGACHWLMVLSLLWLYLLGWSGLLTCHLGSGCGFHLHYAVGHQKWSSSMSPMDPATAAFLWGGLLCPRGCDLNPIGGWDIFQNLHISECGQGLHRMLMLQVIFCQLARLTWGQWLGFFHPMLEGSCISLGLLRLHQLVVLAAKPHILE